MLREFARRIGLIKTPSQNLEAVDAFANFRDINFRKAWEYGENEVVVSVYGGKKFGGVWTKEMYLYKTNEFSYGKVEVMRIQIVSEPNCDLHYNLYLDTMNREKEAYELANEAYYWEHKGLKSETHNWGYLSRMNKHSELTNEENEAKLSAELQKSLYYDDELPKEIDIQKTIELFVRQIQERNFSKPKLLPKI